MKRNFLVIGFLIYSVPIFSQKTTYSYIQHGLIVGASLYSGDITPNYSNVINIFKEMRPSFGYGFYKGLSPIYVIGLEGSYNMLYANENNHRQVNNGIVFNTHLLQFNLVNEIIARKFGKHFYKTKWAPYGKFGLGLGAFSPNIIEPVPMTNPNLIVYDQAYFLINYFIGGGVKLRTKYRYSVGIEATFHYTNVDYLDGFKNATLVTFNDVYGGVRIIISKYYFGKNLNIK